MKLIVAFLASKIKRIRHWKYVYILSIANVASFIKIFIYAKLISLEEFGHYATLTLVSSIFLIVGSLGFLTELQRTLPVSFRSNEIFNVLKRLFQILVIVATVFILGIGLGLILSSHFSMNKSTLVLGLFGGFSQLLFSIITSETRSRQWLVKYSNEILIKNVLTLSAGLVAIYLSSDGFSLFLVESIGTFIFASLLFQRLLPDLKRFGYRNVMRESYKDLKHYHWLPVLSMFGISLLAFVMQNGERYFAKTFLTIENFAILSFGLIITNMASTIQTMLNSSIFINQVLRHDEHGYKGVIKYSLRMSFFSGLLFFLLSLPLYFVTKEVIVLYYPKYIDILQYLPIIYIAFIFRCSDFISNVFIIINRPHVVIFIQSAYLVCITGLVAIVSQKYINLSDPLLYFILNFTNAAIPALITLVILLQLKTRSLRN